ncbi:hypothetical protein [Crenothrix polyspora]|uniref:Elongation factor-1 alpha n=1 Tax=Crenothrix polyspora TaxID=360316 RepID=A0A1R4GZ53_9GAMM|nr:hypothetical protein [Crenothrix polyspora]SJM89241.1 conserved membrane hypothetical protein [Crenothrix polyspora]
MNSTLRQMNSSFKCLFSGYLLIIALGYAMAGLQILMTSGMADGQLGLSISDVVYSYHGNPTHSLLETKLNGSMQDKLSETERTQLITWLHKGAKKKAFDLEIKAIIDARCVRCHYAGNPSNIPDFSVFDNLKVRSVTQGASVATLTRLSHIHLFSIAFIFFSVGFIFAFSSGLPIKLKNTVLMLPYLFLAMDVSSWWLTKLDAHFAWLVIISGVGLGLVFMLMWSISLYEMWFARDKTTDTRG